ncbi:MAG: hypothetical protein HQK79_22085 [Desulfobacterales bacterium]|nr:hypothetical protein [Desulfobacterales bacterium]
MMNKSFHQIIVVTLLGLLFSLFSGCGTLKIIETDAKFKHPLFAKMGIQTITVLPVLDQRIEKTLDTKLTENIHPVMERELKKKGYKVNLLTDPTYISSINYNTISSLSTSWVKSLGPNSVEWIMLIVVKKLYRTMMPFIGARGYADLSGYIYNKNTGEKIWESEGHGEYADGLIVAYLVDDIALQNATTNLTQSIPIKRDSSR